MMTFSSTKYIALKVTYRSSKPQRCMAWTKKARVVFKFIQIIGL